ncbi:MAG: carboxypeptidase regulatory-like domain-containing protein [Spirochaetales bacterium]|nr:carboxypeptidase regulatory-like domain-containing protein [Spirochaetales bacterium]
MKKYLNLFIIIMFFFSACNLDVNPGNEQTENFYHEISVLLNLSDDSYLMVDNPLGIILTLETDRRLTSEFNIRLKYDPQFFELCDEPNYRSLHSIVKEIDVQLESPGNVSVKGNFSGELEPGTFNILELFLKPLIPGVSEISMVEAFVNTVNYRRIKLEKFSALSLQVRDNLGDRSIEGVVLASVGDKPVTGSLVRLEPLGWEVISDELGRFAFNNVPQGIYDLKAKKAGRAGSRLQSVSVINDSVSNLVIIQPEYEFAPDADEPPRVSFKNLDAFQEVSGLLNLECYGVAGSAPLVATQSHYSMSLKISMASINYHQEAKSSDDELTFLWNTTLLPLGEVFLTLVAYDNNNNRCEMTLPLLIVNPSGKAPQIVPQDNYFQIIANTYGESLNVMKSYAPPISKAPSGTTIVVDFNARKYFNGFVVYKSHQANEDSFMLLGQSSLNSSGGFSFADYAPDLVPGGFVYYRLAYYNQYGIGPMTAVKKLLILPSYKIYLRQPADGAIITTRDPVISWECNHPLEDLGARRTDLISVTNTLDATIVTYTFVNNTQDYHLKPLIYNNTYEWDVKSFYEYKNDSEDYNVLSRSFPRGLGATDLSSNGAFTFTVVEDE